MVFSSYIFVFYFLPFSLLLYYPIPSRPLRHFLLTVTSWIFYGWGSPNFVFFMIATTLLDYVLGRVQAHNGFRNWKEPIPILEPGGPRSRIQKAAFLTALIVDLGLLAFFKYFNFAADNYHSVSHLLGMSAGQTEDILRVVLPIGISFYVFQEISYAIDIYRGETRAMRSLNDYVCFVAQYQQMVAGPIVRYAELADQMDERSHTVSKFARGVALFSLGMAIKVLLANPCGKVADTVFNAESINTLDAWYGLVAYSFQIFFDFAGYSDMAVGLGLMMGFVFAKNFETPYQADSITDFWRRWHISLSTILRDYLYIPLGGNRLGEARTYCNLLITMLLGGLWHGASWNFLIWGGLHGAFLALERLVGKKSFYYRLPRFCRVGLTFFLVAMCWVLFRSADLPSAVGYYAALFGLSSAQPGANFVSGIIHQPYYLTCFAIAAGVTWLLPSAWDWTQKLTWPKIAICLFLLWFSLAVLLTQAYNPFIYFIF